MQHEVFEDSGFESQGAAAPERVRFCEIRPEHVDRIVRGRDRGLFLKYFADAVHAKFAKDSPQDRLEMAALFHQVVRVGEAESPGRVIHKGWKKRATKPLTLAQADEEFARGLLAPPPAPSTSAARLVPPLLEAESCAGFSAEELAQQQERRLGNLQALRLMSAQS